MNKIKTILMGTPEFAEKIFRKSYSVLQNNFEITHIITAQDKPIGRKQILIPSPVKQFAQEKNIPILQPDKIRKQEWIEKLKQLNPELIILCAYGQIIPKEILDIPKYGALNIHPSLLPKYRGASPIHQAILNGDESTGITLMLMDEQMDHGNIISQKEYKIKNNITYKELENELTDIALNLLIESLLNWIKNQKSIEQDHEKATFCKMIKKQDGQIDWNNTAEQIHRKIRAYHVWPIAYTMFKNKQLKILEAETKKENTNNQSGTVLNDLNIQTKDNILIIKKLQLEGKKPMISKEFLNGYPDIVNYVFE
ncbi:methionyl-tRNA formyltransferase [Patescibacteria group bacterium]|nr:methionyl-tRNA formyltransferase [Patescibacteria group bacterium]